MKRGMMSATADHKGMRQRGAGDGPGGPRRLMAIGTGASFLFIVCKLRAKRKR